MLRSTVHIILLLIVFASSTFGGVSTLLRPSLNDEAGILQADLSDDRAVAQQEGYSFVSAGIAAERHQPLIFEGVEDENTELSEEKVPQPVSFSIYQDITNFSELITVHIGKSLVYFQNQWCFHPIQQLYLLLKVFRL